MKRYLIKSFLLLSLDESFPSTLCCVVGLYLLSLFEVFLLRLQFLSLFGIFLSLRGTFSLKSLKKFDDLDELLLAVVIIVSFSSGVDKLNDLDEQDFRLALF